MMTLLAFVFAFGVLVVVHEYGHYIVARACGVKVLRFSVGFGPVVASRVIGRDGTEWALSAVPLGGYVKMLDERESETEIAPADLPRAFNRQPVWKRFLIVLAGPAANILLAVVLSTALYLHGVPGMRPVVAGVTPQTPAAAAGFARGDVMLRVGDTPVTTTQDAVWALFSQAVDRNTVEVQVQSLRGERMVRELNLEGMQTAQLDADFLDVVGFKGLAPPMPTVVGKVVAGRPAERAGLRSGDHIMAVNGQPVADWEDMTTQIAPRAGATLTLDVERAGERLTLTLTPDSVDDGHGGHVGQIGIGSSQDEKVLDAYWAQYQVEARYGPVAALRHAAADTWGLAVGSLRIFGKMLTGMVSPRNLGGPITIAEAAGNSAHAGWLPYVNFIAFVSISLAVLNLLPIPLLDGGLLMYYMFEIFKGSPVSERVMEYGQRVGIALLLLLMTFALYNDITRHIFHG